MKINILIVAGVILMGVGLIVFQSNMRIKINNRPADAEESNFWRNAIGGGVGGLGLIFVLGGVYGMVRGSQQAKRNQYLTQNGIAAEGTVTFVDKNYYTLVNNRPIYSIVEYTYLDKAGNQHTRRVDNLSSDVVIRNQVQVGGKVTIKYSQENPGESVILLVP
jgi:hypothetical protein